MSPHDIPLFSIAMPAYNAAATIAEAIESVLAQTFADWELIIVDDGSTDATGGIAASYAARDRRIGLIHQDNAGCGPARGSAVKIARGGLIARFDADDVYLPDYLAEMACFVEDNPGFEIYSCNGEVFFPDGRTMLYHREPAFRAVRSLTFEDMALRNSIFSPAVFRREIFEPAGGFRPGVYTEDYDLWLRAMARGARHIYLPKVLIRYRISGSQMSVEWLRVWEGEVGVLADLLVGGALDESQTRAVRTSIRRHWHARASKAFEALFDRTEQHSAGRYFLPAASFPWWRRAMFAVTAVWYGSLTYAERGGRALVAVAIAGLRRVFPALRDFRLRRG